MAQVEANPTLQWQALFSRASQVHITIPVLIVFNMVNDFTSRHAILAFIIPTLLGFLQIQTSGTEPSPFQSHPVTTRASVISALGYYLLFGVKLWLPTFASQLGIAMSVLGSFSVASLGSLLLPHSLWPFRFVLYVIVMVAEWHSFLRKIYVGYVRRLLHWRPLRMREARRQLLPQTSMDLVGLRR